MNGSQLCCVSLGMSVPAGQEDDLPVRENLDVQELFRGFCKSGNIVFAFI